MRYFPSCFLVAAMIMIGSLGYADTIGYTFEADYASGATAFKDVLGGTISGSFSYDSFASGLGSAPKNYPALSFTFTTSNGYSGEAASPTIGLYNDYVATIFGSQFPQDQFYLSDTNILSENSPSGTALFSLYFQIYDSSMMIFSNDSLPADIVPAFEQVGARINLVYTYSPTAKYSSYYNVTSLQASAVPEPASLVLLGTGLGMVGLAVLRRRK